jgi:hypothetical protein
MEEFEMLDGVAEMFEGAEAEAEGLALSEASEVEASAEVEEVANAPAIEEGAAEAPGTLDKIRNFIKNNPTGQKLWSFATWAAKTGASASAVFAIMYGLNQAVAKDAHQSGKRTALSQYLAGVQSNWENKLKLPWSDDLRQKAAVDALSFPWIDATA